VPISLSLNEARKSRLEAEERRVAYWGIFMAYSKVARMCLNKAKFSGTIPRKRFYGVTFIKTQNHAWTSNYRSQRGL